MNRRALANENRASTLFPFAKHFSGEYSIVNHEPEPPCDLDLRNAVKQGRHSKSW
jgi:hypothetical protein